MQSGFVFGCLYIAPTIMDLNLLACMLAHTSSIPFDGSVPPIVNVGDWGCIVRDLETIIVLVLLAFNFISRIKKLCNCNSDTWGWHNSHQSGVISITDQFIFQNGKKLRSVQEEQ